jgi:hypothetical protein
MELCVPQAEVGEGSRRGEDSELPLSRSQTAATRFADCGADARTIAALLGHATIQMSARYTHATDEGTRRAVDKLLDFGSPGHKSVTKQERQIL